MKKIRYVATPPSRTTAWAAGIAGAIVSSIFVAALVGAYGQLWSANATNAQYQERLKTLEAEVDKLKGIPPAQSAILTSLGNATTEITNLRTLWIQAQTQIVQSADDGKNNANEILNIREKAVADEQDIAKLREQVAGLTGAIEQRAAAPPAVKP